MSLKQLNGKGFATSILSRVVQHMAFSILRKTTYAYITEVILMQKKKTLKWISFSNKIYSCNCNIYT